MKLPIHSVHIHVLYMQMYVHVHVHVQVRVHVTVWPELMPIIILSIKEKEMILYP